MKSFEIVTANSILKMRAIAFLVGLTFLFASAYFFASPDISLILLIGVVGQLIWILACWWMLKRDSKLSSNTMMLQLAVDVFLLSLILFASGGPSNPFISYLFVIISLAAVSLATKATWIISGLAIAAYTFLTFAVPVNEHAHHDQAFNLHLLGMWVNFCIGAVLIAYFVTKTTRALAQSEQELATTREASLIDQSLVTMGIFAASTSHELGTPLSTIGLLVDDATESGRQLSSDETQLIQQQVTRCRAILTRLSQKTQSDSFQNRAPQSIQVLLSEIKKAMVLLKPQANIDWPLVDSDLDHVFLEDNPTLEQSLVSIILNAIDACQHKVNIELGINNSMLKISVIDDGLGFNQEVQSALGKDIATTKTSGLGIGLLLANAAIKKLRGTLQCINRPEGGGCVIVSLPLISSTH